MSSFPYVDHQWTKRELKTECYSRGMHSYARLSKHHLIELLNDDSDSRRAYDPHGHPGPPAVYSSGAAGYSQGPANHRSEERDHSMDGIGDPSDWDAHIPQQRQQQDGSEERYRVRDGFVSSMDRDAYIQQQLQQQRGGEERDRSGDGVGNPSDRDARVQQQLQHQGGGEEPDRSRDMVGNPSDRDAYIQQLQQQDGSAERDRLRHVLGTPSGRAAYLQHLEERDRLLSLYEPWTERQLKDECWRRGHRDFEQLNKRGLVALLRQDGRGPSASAPPPRVDPDDIRRQEMLAAKQRAEQAYASKVFAEALRLYTQAIDLVHQQELAGTATQFDRGMKVVLLGDRAAARVNMGNVEEALSDCEEACRLNPGFGKMTLLKARLHTHLNQWEPSIQSFRTFFNADDNYSLARRLYEVTAIAPPAQSPEAPTEAFEKVLKDLQEEDTRMYSYLINKERARAVELDARARRRRVEAAAEAEAEALVHRHRALELGGSDGVFRDSGRAIVDSPRGNAIPAQARASRGIGSSTPAAVARERDRNTCAVCLDKEINCTLVPCGHHCCCMVCATQFEQCPVCRRDVDQKIRTYSA